MDSQCGRAVEPLGGMQRISDQKGALVIENVKSGSRENHNHYLHPMTFQLLVSDELRGGELYLILNKPLNTVVTSMLQGRCGRAGGSY